ncbi:MAG: bifunctional 5,10-methylenetetrahydrofolate dehydrogenase/5,10-methenyltetrahydrofolate cyclohydrolase [Candidatus Aenigmarchaeota archaeon]|nr:bifunctional 5,10-methylenetetrahydrofolate dehydrogenase/5,10-methenyltetrahydrofolate cyclohydrolase [Candidatus Aenigmarchaeota archaeon]
MTCKIVDGNAIADRFLAQTKKYIEEHKIRPKLATVLVGSDPASETYVNIKKKTCESAGISVDIYKIEPNAKKLEELIGKLNKDQDANGILVQLPLPKDINTQKTIEMIDPLKDVDGIHPINLGRLAYGDESAPACTPYGIVKILEEENIELSGANVAIIGRGVHVGKPLYSLLYNRNCTVTMCHTKTKNSDRITREADIVIVAVGKPNYLNADMIKDGAVVIDVGINKVGGKLVGDADPSVIQKASVLTPVPGGVGPMTVAMLAQNTLNAYIRQNEK